jgi:predicted amidohydrolase YtcJ
MKQTQKLYCEVRAVKLYTNASFITCEPGNNATYSAMAVNKGRIVWIGNDVPKPYRSARMIDLGGATVVPAFGDTHLHFESFCLFNNTFFVMDANSFDEMGRIVKAYVEKHVRDKVILGFGCSAHTVKEERLPVRADLDQWTDRPLLIIKYDGHAAVCNTALMNLLSDEVKRDYGCDVESGWLYQNAFFSGVNEVTARVPSMSIVSGLSKGADYLAKEGIGLIHNVEGVGFANDLDVDMMRILGPGLPIASRMFFQTMDIDAVVKRGLKCIGGCFKLALDGCFGSEDAALLEPYANNTENCGKLYYSQDQVNDFCIRANRAGLQIAIHAIGDAAVEQAVNAYEAALKDMPRADHRHVLIHCCLCTPEQLDRLAALKISIAAQAPFIFWRQEPDAYLRGILGTSRTDQLNPLKSMMDRGLMVGDGSDAPTTLPNPIFGMHCAVNHPTPSERISPLNALMMRTYNPAYMTFDEASRGSLTAGKIADFAVLSENPLTIEHGRIQEIRVLGLYLAGKKHMPTRKGALGLLFASGIRRLLRKKFL